MENEIPNPAREGIVMGVGWFTLISYAPESLDKVRTAAYWKAIWDPNIKSFTVQDLKNILEKI